MMRITCPLAIGLSIAGVACGPRAPADAPQIVACGSASPFKTKAARIAIASFKSDADNTASDLLVGAIRRLDEELNPDGQHRLFEVARIDRIISSHDTARSCAENLRADVVVWGTLVANKPMQTPSTVSTKVEVGRVEAGDNATIRIGNIDLGGKPFTLLPSVTLRRKQMWLMTSSRMDVISLADVDFNAIASDRSLFFVPFLGGVAAIDRGDTQQALFMLELATRGSVNAEGLPRLYAKTYLGTIFLSQGKAKEAAQALAETSEHLADAPSQLIWQNRLLYGLANEESGDLVAAGEGYRAASEQEPRLSARLREIAPLARANLEMHRGNATGAWEAFRLLNAALSNCQEATIDCVFARGATIRQMMMKAQVLALSGHTNEAHECMTQAEAATKEVTAWAQKTFSDKDGKALAASTLQPLSADTPPTAYQTAMTQIAGCSMVHAPWVFASMWQGHEPNSGEDAVRLFKHIKDGEGTLGNLIQKQMPPRLAHKYLVNLACAFSIAANELGDASNAAELARKAAEMLNQDDGSLLRVEVQLLAALPTVRRSKALSSRPSVAATRRLISESLPALTKAMGADAPAVKAWQAAVTSNKLVDAVANGPAPTRCLLPRQQ